MNYKHPDPEIGHRLTEPPKHDTALHSGFPEPRINELDRADWLWIGFKFGIGFMLASTIFAAVGGAISYAVLTHQMRLVLNAAGGLGHGQFLPPPMPAPQSSPYQVPPSPALAPQWQPAPQPDTRYTAIAPRSKDDCLKESHGVYDETYQACMRSK